jgi:hypothetical protein
MSAVLHSVTNTSKATSGKHKKKGGAKQHQHLEATTAHASDSSALPSPHNGPTEEGHDVSGEKEHIRELAKYVSMTCGFLNG